MIQREAQKKNITETDTKQNELAQIVDQLKMDLDAKTEQNRIVQSSLQKNQTIADERREKVSELGKQIKKYVAEVEALKLSVSERVRTISILFLYELVMLFSFCPNIWGSTGSCGIVSTIVI